MRRMIFFLICIANGAQATALPEPRQYWCSLDDVEDVIGGVRTFDDSPYEANRRPTLLSFPHEDQSELVFATVNEAGTVYAYIRSSGDGATQHMIHGVFDFETARLTTSRANLLPTNDGKWLPQSVSFVSVCSEAND